MLGRARTGQLVASPASLTVHLIYSVEQFAWRGIAHALLNPAFSVLLAPPWGGASTSEEAPKRLPLVRTVIRQTLVLLLQVS